MFEQAFYLSRAALDSLYAEVIGLTVDFRCGLQVKTSEEQPNPAEERMWL